MRYISTFSGIEAATVAWAPMGWEPMAFSEIDPFCCALLQHRYPEVKNLGDITKVDWKEFVREYGRPDILIGGSPCTSFSIAGSRTSLAGESRLMFEYIRACGEVRSEWIVWENTPGCLNTKDNAFAQLLDSLQDIGYLDLSWRVLDAQLVRVPLRDDSGAIAGWFGPVAQRRRRVFLVGHLGAGGASAAVLFEPESLSGHNPSSKQKRQELAGALGRGASAGGGAGCLTPCDVQSKRVHSEDACCPTLNSGTGEGMNIQPVVLQGEQPAICLQTDHISQDGTNANLETCKTLDTQTSPAVCYSPLGFVGGNGGNTNMGLMDDCALTMTVKQNVDVAYALKVRCGKDTYTKPDGSIGTAGKGALVSEDVAYTLATSQDQTIVTMASGQANAEVATDNTSPTVTCLHEQPIVCHEPMAIDCRNDKATEGVSGTLQSKSSGGYSLNYQNPVAYETDDEDFYVTIHDGTRWIVRRLTPVECERLMGMPDGYTDVPYKGKEHPPDTPRYKALGNSFATPCIRWLGERIQMVQDVLDERGASSRRPSC